MSASVRTFFSSWSPEKCEGTAAAGGTVPQRGAAVFAFVVVVRGGAGECHGGEWGVEEDDDWPAALATGVEEEEEELMTVRRAASGWAASLQDKAGRTVRPAGIWGEPVFKKGGPGVGPA